MLKVARITLALAVAGFVLPALAGNSWPQGPSTRTSAASAKSEAPANRTLAKPTVSGGFVYAGEGTGWEVSQHKYVLTKSGLAHSDECDHVIRSAPSVSLESIEESRKQYRGG